VRVRATDYRGAGSACLCPLPRTVRARQTQTGPRSCWGTHLKISSVAATTVGRPRKSLLATSGDRETWGLQQAMVCARAISMYNPRPLATALKGADHLPPMRG